MHLPGVSSAHPAPVTSLQVHTGCQHHFPSTVYIPVPAHPQCCGLRDTGGVQGSIPVSLPPISLFLVLQGKVSPGRGHGCCSRRVRGFFQAGGITAVLTWILPLWFCLPAFRGREDDWKAFCQLRNQYLSY